MKFASGNMVKNFTLLIIAISYCLGISAQSVADSTEKILDAVVVTGTRTENKVRNLPMPIQVITAKTLEKTGSENLLDILQMQTGLVMAVNPLGVALQGYPNPFGTGIQMQGLDPAYTLILIDGEPLTGRNAGILNLGRIAVGNIRQIEILRGPSTSLYGSDALAGVINIITKTPDKDYLKGRVQYGSNNGLGLTLSGGIKTKKTAIEIFGRRYSNDGWDFDKNIYGQTVDPSRNYSMSVKTVTRLNTKDLLTFSGRYFNQKEFNNYQIIEKDAPEAIKGTTVEIDKSLFGKWEHKVNEKFNYTASLYTTGYDNHANAFVKENDSLYEKLTFNQFLLKPEIQVNIGDPDQLWVAGSGYNYETVRSSRYGPEKEMDSWFVYLQKQFVIQKRLNVIAGGRYDKNSLYDAQFSPKVAAAYKITPGIIVKGSVGAGFKAPDFRQQFLNFSNSLIGYTILGARELGDGLTRLQETGRLSKTADISPYMNGVILRPERSIGYNLGIDYTISPDLFFQVNLFRNDINDLIESYSLPFNQTNGKNIFSYKNVDKVFTEGAELHVNYCLNKNFRIIAGYNYLVAKDKRVLTQIRNEKIYRRDPATGISQLVKESDYKGLYNRSKHTANLNLQYQNELLKGSAMLSVKYRGKYGFLGINDYVDGNDILDDPREFAEGYTLVNLILCKEINKHLNVQAGLDNILNYTQPLLLPAQFGRSYFLNLNFQL